MMLEEERGRRNVFIDGEPSCNTRFQSCKYIVDDLDSLSSFVFLCSPNSTSGFIEYFSGTHKKEEEDSNGKCPRSVNRWRFSASTRISPVVGVLCINDAGNTWSMMAQGDGGISLISNQHDFPFPLLQIYIYRLDFLTLLHLQSWDRERTRTKLRSWPRNDLLSRSREIFRYSLQFFFSLDRSPATGK